MARKSARKRDGLEARVAKSVRLHERYVAVEGRIREMGLTGCDNREQESELTELEEEG